MVMVLSSWPFGLEIVVVVLADMVAMTWSKYVSVTRIWQLESYVEEHILLPVIKSEVLSNAIKAQEALNNQQRFNNRVNKDCRK